MKILTILAVLSFAILSCNHKKKTSDVNYAYINIKIDGAKPNDTLTLSFWQNVLSPNLYSMFIKPKIFKNGMNNTGLFVFKIPMENELGYFIISKDRDENYNSITPIFDRYLIEPGDSIKITIKKRSDDYKYSVRWNYSGLNDLYKDYTLIFSGKGVKKYQCRYAIDTTTEKSSYYPSYLFPLGSLDYIIKNHYKHSIYISDSILSIFQQSISPLAFQILKADFYAKFEIQRFQLFDRKLKNTKLRKDSAGLKKMELTYMKYFDKDLPIRVDSQALAMSNNFAKYAVAKATTLSNIKGRSAGQYVYDYLKIKYESQALRDKILTLYLVQNYRVLNGLQNAFTDAQKIIQTPYCLDLLNTTYSRISVGKPAFNFVLPDTAGNIISLQDLKGKIVFIDFWFYGCGACHSFYKRALSKVEEYYRDNDEIVFVSISIDRKRSNWLKGIYGGGYTSARSENVINLYTGGTGTHNSLINYYKIPGYPYLLLIDKNGRIYNSNLEDLSNLANLKRYIEQLLN